MMHLSSGTSSAHSGPVKQSKQRHPCVLALLYTMPLLLHCATLRSSCSQHLQVSGLLSLEGGPDFQAAHQLGADEVLLLLQACSGGVPHSELCSHYDGASEQNECADDCQAKHEW